MLGAIDAAQKLFDLLSFDGAGQALQGKDEEVRRYGSFLKLQL